MPAAGRAGVPGGGDASAAPAARSCGDSLDGSVEWPTELTVGTRLVSEVGTSYVVQTDCGVLTLVRSDDRGSCYYMTGYGLQRYPCSGASRT